MRVVAISILLIGCSSDGGDVSGGVLDPAPTATLTADPASAKPWIELSSAPMALYLGEMPVGLASFYAQADTPCPTETVDGDVTTYQGGCTDGDGHEWLGTATVTGGPNSAFYGSTIVYDGFQLPGEMDCNGTEVPTHLVFNGTVTITSATGSGGTFDIDVKYEADAPDPTNNCQLRPTAVGLDYHGSVTPGTLDHDGDGDIDDATWNGSGRYGSNINGVVSLATADEYIDNNVCQDEALSGTTTIKAGSHTIGVTYDGLTDCDTTHTVRWTFDGADQGELEGISCNAGGGSSGALVLLALVGLVRRRGR